MKKKVIAAGHICLDITPKFENGRANRLTDILIPGKLINVGEADVHTGGSVANTGLAMKLLGADVSLMGKIGKDTFGDMVLKSLEKYGAEKDMLISSNETTSYSVVLAMPGIDRIFLHNPGANDTFCGGDIPQRALESADLFHFGYPPLMKQMYQNDGDELLEILCRAEKCGAATSLDFAAIDEESEAGKADWEKLLERWIPHVDFFVPSVEELCFMLDKERYADWQRRAQGKDITEVLDVETDVRPLAEQCMSFGAKVLLIKCGAKGMYYQTADRLTLLKAGVKAELDINKWAEKKGFEKSYVPDKVVSGTGAGDTCIAAFLTAVLEGYSPEHAVRLAAAAGAACVAEYDALSGLKSFEELERRINHGWKKRGE